MSDIVERLRGWREINYQTAFPDGAMAEDIREAADEIERLRRERMALDEALRQEIHHVCRIRTQ